MTKHICDFCEKNVADSRYRVYEESLISSLFGTQGEKVDICNECYQKLFRRKKGSEENEID